jgi:hypothetical protein
MPLVPRLILAPAALVALMLCGVEAYRAVRPVDGDRPASLADAILHGSVEQAYTFIRQGQDPNGVITVQDPDFAGGRRMMVSPLVVAVAAREDNAVAMLLSAGARVDLPANALAVCLAKEMHEDGTLEMLQPHPEVASGQCPEHVLGP